MLRDLYHATRPGTLLLVRSARGLRTLLYPEVDVNRLGGWRPLAVVHPFTEVVNSVIVAERN